MQPQNVVKGNLIFPQTEATQIAMQPRIDPTISLPVDYAVAQIMGPWIFNLQDPFYVQHKNVPRNLPHCWHWQIFLATVYLAGSIMISILVVSNGWTPKHPKLAPTLITIQGLIVYLAISFCFSQTWPYLKNVRPSTAYQQCYDRMVRSPPKFRFTIQCYHFESKRDKKGRTSRQKVVSHYAQKFFEPAEWIDESGVLESIHEEKQMIFLKCHPTFYFSNKQAQKTLEDRYRAFIDNNLRDEYQNMDCKFIIPGFQQQIAYNMRGEAKVMMTLFYIMTCLGLGFIYCKLLQCCIARYEIYILKRINK